MDGSHAEVQLMKQIHGFDLQDGIIMYSREPGDKRYGIGGHE